MIQEFYEVYYLTPEGFPIDHKDQREHEELTFLDSDEAITKAEELFDQGHRVGVWHTKI